MFVAGKRRVEGDPFGFWRVVPGFFLKAKCKGIGVDDLDPALLFLGQGD
jgi:hypothetical protein